MPRPFLIDSQSDYLVQIVDINSDTEWHVNSADPGQLASSEAYWSGSALFAKAGYIWVQKDKDSPWISFKLDKKEKSV